MFLLLLPIRSSARCRPSPIFVFSTKISTSASTGPMRTILNDGLNSLQNLRRLENQSPRFFEDRKSSPRLWRASNTTREALANPKSSERGFDEPQNQRPIKSDGYSVQISGTRPGGMRASDPLRARRSPGRVRLGLYLVVAVCRGHVCYLFCSVRVLRFVF